MALIPLLGINEFHNAMNRIECQSVQMDGYCTFLDSDWCGLFDSIVLLFASFKKSFKKKEAFTLVIRDSVKFTVILS